MMQYVGWLVVAVFLIFGGSSVVFNLCLTCQYCFDKWHGKTKDPYASGIPLVGTITSLLLLVASPLYQNNKAIKTTAWLILLLDASSFLASLVFILWRAFIESRFKK